MDQFDHLVVAVIKAAYATKPAIVLVPSDHQKDLAGSIQRKLFGGHSGIACQLRSGIAHARMEGESDV